MEHPNKKAAANAAGKSLIILTIINHLYQISYSKHIFPIIEIYLIKENNLFKQT